jgi:tetratricopeptide (TPR) repeat protein
LQQLLAPIRTGQDAPEPHQLRTLALVLIAGLAAGLVNPHHYHAFTLPASIAPWTPLETLERDRSFKLLFLSPLREEYYVPGLGWNIAGLAYFPLVAIGLLSFVLSFFAAWRWWRLLVWLGFAALGAYQARNVPFFAVVGGPIAALNLQDFTVASFGDVPRVERHWKAWSLGGRLVSALAGVLLLAAAWPGWLHGRPSDTRQFHRVGWQVAADDSLRKVAEQLRAWRAQGLLRPEEQGFNFSADVANYLAWFGSDDKTGLPSEKAYLDTRLELFPADVTRKYVDIREALRTQSLARDSGSRPINWPDVFRKQNITHVVLSYTDPATAVVWLEMLQDWSQWSLVALVDGRAWVFSWNDPLKRAAAGEARLPRFSVNAAAFGPAAQSQASGEETAPAAPQPPDLFGRYLRGSPAHPAEADEALSYLAYFEILRESWYRPYLVSKEFADMTAAVVASGTSPATATAALPVTKIASIPVTLALQKRPDGLTYALFGTDHGPPGAPLLAVRAARKAIQASPGDPQAYLTLAQSYYTLWREQEEHWTGQASYVGMPRMARQQLRHIQMTTALEQAVKLRPDDASAHMQLFQIYGTLNYLDLALEHFQEYVNLLALGPNESQEDFNKRADPVRTALKNLETRVGRERNQFELEQTNKRPLEKAVLAQRRGLAKRALQVLLQTDPSQMDKDAIDMEVHLLLTTGASSPDLEHGLDDVRQMLDSIKFGLGSNYERYAFWVEAAAGDYQKADKYITAAIRRLEKNCAMMVLDAVRAQTLTGDRLGGVQEFTYWLQNIKMIADYKVMQAMVEMEAGNVAAAARHCEEALNLNNGQPFDFDSKMIAVHYLKQIRDAGGAK